MKRRQLLFNSLWFLLPFQQIKKKDKALSKGIFSLDENRLKFYHKDISTGFICFFIADTHLFKDDTRGDSYREFSGRMAKAYNKTKHFQTGKETDPETAFTETLAIAKKENASLLILAGDIFSFPSEAAIDFVLEALGKIGIPYVFTAGNHDWHYEGMGGSSDFLRKTWINKRLLKLYQGENPYYAVTVIHGIRIVTIDNSTYEINQEQLDFFEKQLNFGAPVLLCLHIPIFVQGRNLGFGCGHPEWNGKNDKNFELEKREPWRISGHHIHTLTFHRRIVETPHLIGILAGHIHQTSLDILKNGVPQVVAPANAFGGYLSLHFEKEVFS
jgi:predicted phosphodiesterase